MSLSLKSFIRDYSRASLALLIGVLALVRWLFFYTWQPDVLNHWFAMKANTALCFVAASSAMLVRRRSPLAARLLALPVLLVGMVTALEYLLGVNFGIDEILFTDIPGSLSIFAPGRMALNAALAFTFVGAAIFTLGNDRQGFHPAQIFALLVLLLTVPAAIIYLLGADFSHGIAPYAQMAVPSCVAFIALAAALLREFPDAGYRRVATSTGPGRVLIRVLLPAVTAITIIVGWLALRGEKAGLYDAGFGLTLSVIFNIGAFTPIVMICAHVLNKTRIDRDRIFEELEFERAQLERAAALRESEARHRAIIETAFDAVIGMDARGMICEWNHKAEAMFGWRKDEIFGRSFSDTIIPQTYRNEEVKGLRRLLADGQHSVLNRLIELTAVRRSGEEFPIQISISPVQNGKSFLFTAFVADITERKRNERELIDARQQALAALKVKSAFLANMSHEIRTPLNGVIGMADLLLDTTLDETQRRYAKVMQDSGAGLLTIVNDILDFSKIEAGKLELELIDFNLAAAVEGQAELLAGKAREKGLSLSVFVDPSLPLSVIGDAGRIGQVLLNLLGNALKFTKEGGVSLRVTATAAIATMPDQIACDGVVIRFEVRDTGIGLAPQALERLFNPFEQADGSTARQFGGTGLGLSISKRLVEMMGGDIGVSSEPGRGSTFWFTLCLATNAVQVLRHDPALAGARILVVDGDAASREVFLAYLRSWSISAEAVATHDAAFAALLGASSRGQAFNAAIIDAVLGQDEAIALANRIKASSLAKATRLLMTTTIGGLALEARARLAGFTGFLTKPVKQSDLFDGLVDTLAADDKPQVLPPVVLKAAQAELAVEVNCRVLVAEDNAVNQLLALTMLKKIGCSAIAVANGREAVEAWRLSPFDAILMDCQMPEMDGFEATRIIRSEEAGTDRHIPIIALTANAMREDRDLCLAAGMDDFVTKPVKRVVLKETLERWQQAVPIDESFLRDLYKALDDEKVVRELLDSFVAQMPSRFAAMRTAIERGDGTAVAAQAHAIKSSAGEFGALHLMAILSDLESAAGSAAAAANLDELLSRGVAEWQRVERYLTSYELAA